MARKPIDSDPLSRCGAGVSPAPSNPFQTLFDLPPAEPRTPSPSPSENPTLPAPTPSYYANSTSWLAGEIAAAHAKERYRQIIDHLATHGPSTLFEVAAAIEVGQNQISGRFTELKFEGLIEETGQRRKNPTTGATANVYRLREKRQ